MNHMCFPQVHRSVKVLFALMKLDHGLLAVLPAVVGVIVELYRQGGGPPEPPKPQACPDCQCSAKEVILWLQEQENEKLVVGGSCFVFGGAIASVAWAACIRYGRQAGAPPRRRGGGVLIAR